MVLESLRLSVCYEPKRWQTGQIRVIAIRGLSSFFYRHYSQELLVRRFCEARLKLPAKAEALRLDI